MLHELLLSLVGFTGDIIIDVKDTFRVNPGFNLLNDSELEYISKIVPLGWYYNKLQAFVYSYELQWKESGKIFEVYVAAMCVGISDILNDYVNEVALLEQILAMDGVIHLSQIYQHLNEYFTLLPTVLKLCLDVERLNLKGCRILDIFGNNKYGVPSLTEAIERVQKCVQTVFYKQTINWMIYGKFDDPGNEYFVQQRFRKETAASSARALNRRNQTFSLNIFLLPETHISVLQASKILFTGKVLNLLCGGLLCENGPSKSQETSTSDEHSKVLSSDVYKYLSNKPNENIAKPPLAKLRGLDSPESDDLVNFINDGDCVDKISDFRISNAVFVEKDMTAYRQQLQIILESDAQQSIVLFSHLIDSIHQNVSSIFWHILQRDYSVLSFFQFIRNTYLLGKGEWYQNIFDNLLDLTTAPWPRDINVMNDILKWNVLSSSAKILNLDHENMTSIINLVTNSSDVKITDFYLNSDQLVLETAGYTKIKLAAIPPSARTVEINLSRLVMCELEMLESEDDITAQYWQHFIFNGAIDSTRQQKFQYSPATSLQNQNTRQNQNSTTFERMYVKGIMWVTKQKVFNRGFSTSVRFACNQSRLYAVLNSGHIFLKESSITNNGLLRVGQIGIAFSVDKSTFQKSKTGQLGQIDYPENSVCVHFSIYAQKRELDSVSIVYSYGLSITGSKDTLTADSSSSTIAMKLFPIDLDGQEMTDHDVFNLTVDYSKIRMEAHESTSPDVITASSNPSTYNKGTLFVNTIRVKVSKFNAEELSTSLGEKERSWDIVTPLELSAYLPSQVNDGKFFVGISSHSLLIPDILSPLYSQLNQSNNITGDFLMNPNAQIGNIVFDVFQFEFCQSILVDHSSSSMVSAFTKAHHIDTASKLTNELQQFRAWMNLRLHVNTPQILSVLFDEESMTVYENMFSLLLKVRFVEHGLERLWKSRTQLTSHRGITFLRQTMQFFTSNLVSYLQVDVIDSEFTRLVNEIQNSTDFQLVYKLHKAFLITVSRLAFIDHIAVLEVIEKILMISVRFMALCRVKFMQESKLYKYPEQLFNSRARKDHIQQVNSSKTSDGNNFLSKFRFDVPIVIPYEEITAIKTDYLKHVEQLFKIMARVDNHLFLFRLDFNSYFSKLFNE